MELLIATTGLYVISISIVCSVGFILSKEEKTILEGIKRITDVKN